MEQLNKTIATRAAKVLKVRCGEIVIVDDGTVRWVISIDQQITDIVSIPVIASGGAGAGLFY